MFDLTSRESFLALPRWLGELGAKGSENLQVVLVGNKQDLAEKFGNQKTGLG